MQGSATKFCPDCQETKPLSEFYVYRRDNRCYRRCRSCTSKVTCQWYRDNPEKKRAGNLRQNYKISIQEYQHFYEIQQGVCAACGQPETEVDPRTKLVKNLHVDHCHKTGKVRALLCGGCNTALGHLNDDPERIRLLLRYAEVHIIEDEM